MAELFQARVADLGADTMIFELTGPPESLDAFEERLSQIRLTHTVPDYAQLARAYGAVGLTVDTEEGLEDALAEALAAALSCGRTAVVDARVDPREHCFPMIPAGAAALDMIEFPAEEAIEA